MEKICPLMSSADKIILCTDKCAWRVNHVNGLSKCAIVGIADLIDVNGDTLFNIYSRSLDTEVSCSEDSSVIK